MNKSLLALSLAALASLGAAQSPSGSALPRSFKWTPLQSSFGGKLAEKQLFSKPTVIVFINSSCPHVPKAVPALQLMAAQFKGSVQVLGLLNLDARKGAAYAKKVKLPIPVVYDPKQVMIQALGGVHSMDLAVISPKTKKVEGFWEGISRAHIAEVDGALRKAGASGLKTVASAYGDSLWSGCGFLFR